MIRLKTGNATYKSIVLSVCFIFCIASAVYAAIYSYKRGNGQTWYTDQVPEKYQNTTNMVPDQGTTVFNVPQ